MLVRGALLLISATTDSEVDDTVLSRVQALLGEGLDGFFLVNTLVYTSPPRYLLEETLRRWCDEDELDLILTVGGTYPAPGPSEQEQVPEATAAVLERFMPSLPEAMRAWAGEEYQQALLDRGVAGIRGRTLILNLPAGADLAATFLNGVLDILPLILGRLSPTETVTDMASSDRADQGGGTSGDSQSAAIPSAGTGRGLNQEEFSAFLQRRRRGTGSN